MEYVKHFCDNCNKSSIISPRDLLPHYLEVDDKIIDESGLYSNVINNNLILKIYARCPLCHHINEINSNIMTKEDKKFIMSNYPKDLSDIIFNKWNLEYQKSILENKILDLDHKILEYKCNEISDYIKTLKLF